MIHLLWLSLTLMWRDRYPKKFFLITDILTSLIDTVFYYFTSEAFGKAFGSQNYFQYVIWGELVLALPMMVFLASTKALRSSLIEGTWEILLTSPQSMTKILWNLSLGDFLREAIRLIVVILFSISLGAHFAPILSAKAFFIVLFSVPLFWNLGLIGAALFIYTGRGLSATQHLRQLATIFAGVYFPLTVFPTWLAQLSSWISPWTWLVETSRQETFDNFNIAGIFGLSMIFIFVGPWFLKMALGQLSKSGRRLALLN